MNAPGEPQMPYLSAGWGVEWQIEPFAASFWCTVGTGHRRLLPRLRLSQHPARPGMATVKDPTFGGYGEFMARFNFQQARKQKEGARKARQQEKQQRRSAARPAAADG